jgi:hypothetical protein
MSPMSPRTLRPRAGGLNPRSISGLAAWWDVSTSVTLNANTISAIPDLSGNSRNLVQATGGSQPSYVASAVNGRAVASFDGTRFMAVASSTAAFSFIHQSTGATIYAVINPTSVASNAFLMGNNSSATSVVGFNICTNDGTGARRLQGNVTNGSQNVAFMQFSSFFSAMGSWVAVSAVFDPANATTTSRIIPFRDGTQVSSTFDGGVSGASPSTGNSGQNFVLGNCLEGTSGIAFQGSVGEVLVYSGVHSSATRVAVQKYLKSKWATP